MNGRDLLLLPSEQQDNAKSQENTYNVCLNVEEQYNTTNTCHHETYIDTEWVLQPVLQPTRFKEGASGHLFQHFAFSMTAAYPREKDRKPETQIFDFMWHFFASVPYTASCKS